MAKLKCTCGSDYRSHGDYVLAIRLSIDVDEAHAMFDLFESCLDEALDRKLGHDEYLAKLKEEYGRTVTSGPDQEDS